VDLGPAELGLIILAFVALFGYKKLPDASRSLGRSLRIFKSEMRGMQGDAAPADVPAPAPAPAVAELDAEAAAAEARAAQLRARADAVRTGVPPQQG
jgi:sec-independent protein translocase protein TatA